MKRFTQLILLTILTAHSSSSFASQCLQSNIKLGLVGVDSTSGALHAAVLSSNHECSCQHIKFLPENAETKSVLGVLLAAKVANLPLRIDLLQSNDCFSAYRAYIE